MSDRKMRGLSRLKLHDDLNQYNRPENIRIYGVPKSCSKKDDVEDVLHQIANELDIELED